MPINFNLEDLNWAVKKNSAAGGKTAWQMKQEAEAAEMGKLIEEMNEITLAVLAGSSVGEEVSSSIAGKGQKGGKS